MCKHDSVSSTRERAGLGDVSASQSLSLGSECWRDCTKETTALARGVLVVLFVQLSIFYKTYGRRTQSESFSQFLVLVSLL